MTIYYNWSNGRIDLECEMEYEPEERGSEWEPHINSSAYVERALHKGVDISELLSETTLDEITEEFLKEYESSEGQYEPDYESMLENRRGWQD